jgi:hypothetical protein
VRTPLRAMATVSVTPVLSVENADKYLNAHVILVSGDLSRSCSLCYSIYI